MSRGVFVTGTDTGVGKTLAACALLHAVAARGIAVKAMKPTLAASDDARRRFLREARAAAQVKHDHIVCIYMVGEHEGSPFLAELSALTPGDLVVHMDHGIGRYEGLQSIPVGDSPTAARTAGLAVLISTRSLEPNVERQSIRPLR